MSEMEKLINKAAEYFQCARHLNLRGASEVLKECRPLVADIKRDGKTFKDFCTLVNPDMEPDLENDLFMKNISLMFEENHDTEIK